jgi:hypothetical protein
MQDVILQKSGSGFDLKHPSRWKSIQDESEDASCLTVSFFFLLLSACVLWGSTATIVRREENIVTQTRSEEKGKVSNTVEKEKTGYKLTGNSFWRHQERKQAKLWDGLVSFGRFSPLLLRQPILVIEFQSTLKTARIRNCLRSKHSRHHQRLSHLTYRTAIAHKSLLPRSLQEITLISTHGSLFRTVDENS